MNYFQKKMAAIFGFPKPDFRLPGVIATKMWGNAEESGKNDPDTISIGTNLIHGKKCSISR